MILLRPADPSQPITIHNATEIHLEAEPPEQWWRDNIAFIIEAPNTKITEEPAPGN